MNLPRQQAQGAAALLGFQRIRPGLFKPLFGLSLVQTILPGIQALKGLLRIRRVPMNDCSFLIHSY